MHGNVVNIAQITFGKYKISKIYIFSVHAMIGTFNFVGITSGTLLEKWN